MCNVSGRKSALYGMLVLFAAFSVGGAVEPPTGPQGTPRIQFTVLEHDFGHVDAGADLKTSFAFKNVGDGVLSIQKVKGG